MSKQRPITLRIDVTKILKQHIYAGQKGKYLDLVVWPNKDGIDQYSNTHYVCQEISKAAREAGERGPILGNAKVPEAEPAPRQQQTRPQPARPAPQQEESISVGMEDDDILF